MQFNENAEVQTASGEKVGRIDRVVMDPKSKELTHFVVRKGLIFTTDKVIPLDQVESADGDRVVLKAGAGEADDLGSVTIGSMRPTFSPDAVCTWHFIKLHRDQPPLVRYLKSSQSSPRA